MAILKGFPPSNLIPVGGWYPHPNPWKIKKVKETAPEKKWTFTNFWLERRQKRQDGLI